MIRPPLVEIPEPKAYPVLLHYPQLDLERPVHRLLELHEELGPVYRLRFPEKSAIFIGSHDVMDDLCDETKFQKSIHRTLEFLRDLGGDALFTAKTEEPNWQIANRVLIPAFAPAAVRGMFSSMTDIADQMFVKWDRFGGDTEIDVAEDMTRLTLDTIALCAFSYRFNSFYSKEMHPFVGAMVRGLKEAGKRTGRFPLLTLLMRGVEKRYRADLDFIRTVAGNLIDDRKADALGMTKADLLSRMLSGVDPVTGEQLPDSNIGYQMITFLIAGHETTSGLLSFATYALIKNPAAMAKAREEIDRVVGGREIAYTDIAKLTYVEQILKETLRLWPTAPVFGVTPVSQDEVIGGKYLIKKGEDVMIMLPALHRDREVWGESADEFNPDRFSPENASKIPPNAWKPFGNGIRGCIGRQFAMQEATLVLAKLVQKFEIEFADPSYELTIKETLTLKPDRLKIRARVRPDYRVARSGYTETIRGAALGPEAQFKPGSRLRVLYGSNTGSAENFARRVAEEATARGVSVVVETLDQAVEKIEAGETLLVVTASYNGRPPHNAKKFEKWLSELTPGSLKGVSYAVLGCGNRDWAATYQANPTATDRRLSELGANRYLKRGEADAKGDMLADFEHWLEPFWHALSPALTSHSNAAEPQPSSPPHEKSPREESSPRA